MRDYELTLVFRADLEEEARNQLLERILGWLPRNGNEDDSDPTLNHWGRRQLAYPIKKQNEGYYVMVEVEMESVGLDELERNISYLDEVLRHLLVRKAR